jgi:hypothetical protein
VRKEAVVKPIKIVVYVTLATVAAIIPIQGLVAQEGSDTVAAITTLENDGIKADLAADTSWFDKFLADDWMGCQSDGIWITKTDSLKRMADAHKLKVNNEKLSDLKVRVYGNTAVATYKDDGIVNGKHQSDEVTDVWVKIGSDWKVVSSQGTKAK